MPKHPTDKELDLDSAAAAGFLGLPMEYNRTGKPAFRVITVPFEHTTTYRKGAANGPAALIEASHQVEYLDFEIGARAFELGIVTDRSLEGKCGGDFPSLDPALKAAVSSSMDNGEIPIVLGGEHTITRSCAAAALEKYPDLTIVQIDAHADLRASYDGDPYNHGCVMQRILDISSDSMRLVQIGVRNVCSCELETINSDKRISLFPAISILKNETSHDDILDRIGEKVYLTIDLDGIDPSVIPGVGTPFPGGLTWLWLNEFLERLSSTSRIVAFDVVELCPIQGENRSEFAAASLTYRVMGLISRRLSN